tara:strand:+ start:692 stop:868 length:177 start_codon:yes stop_codon:yes gene_type:complete
MDMEDRFISTELVPQQHPQLSHGDVRAEDNGIMDITSARAVGINAMLMTTRIELKMPF